MTLFHKYLKLLVVTVKLYEDNVTLYIFLENNTGVLNPPSGNFLYQSYSSKLIMTINYVAFDYHYFIILNFNKI